MNPLAFARFHPVPLRGIRSAGWLHDFLKRQATGLTGNIAVAETGTSAGFERFCKEGSTDISNASRPIKDSERADCEAIGREVLEFLVGIDALTVAVSKDSFVDELTRSQLIAIFTGEVTQWNEVNAEWPAATKLVVFPVYDGAERQPLANGTAEFLQAGEKPIVFTPCCFM